MRVVVTGGAGFIGSHLAEALCRAGHDVIVIDDLSTGVGANVPAAARWVQMDVAGRDLVPLLRDVAPQGVIHCAGQVLVSQSQADPMDDMRRNVAGTINVLTACREAGARHLVYASSAAVYGPLAPADLPVREETTRPPAQSVRSLQVGRGRVCAAARR